MKIIFTFILLLEAVTTFSQKRDDLLKRAIQLQVGNSARGDGDDTDADAIVGYALTAGRRF